MMAVSKLVKVNARYHAALTLVIVTPEPLGPALDVGPVVSILKLAFMGHDGDEVVHVHILGQGRLSFLLAV